MTQCDVMLCSMADVLCDDPVQCDVMQYGRCVQMFCENMLQAGSGPLFKIQVFWTVSHYIFSNTSVRTSQLSGSNTPTAIETNSSGNTHSYPPRYTVSLYVNSECYTAVGSLRNVAICMPICICIKLKLQSVKFQIFSHWWCWWVKSSSGTCHDVVPWVHLIVLRCGTPSNCAGTAHPKTSHITTEELNMKKYHTTVTT
jgi:hypothetical protein